MKIVIFYFSGTGNTELVTRQLAEALEGKGNNVELFRIENTETADMCKKMADCDLTGIGYPIYGGGTPAIISDFIMKTP